MASWGDEEDDLLPTPTCTRPDASGVKTSTEWHMNKMGQKVKTVKRIRVSTQTVRASKERTARLARLTSGPRFGLALKDTENVTIPTKEDIRVLPPKEAEADDGNDAMKSALAGFGKKMMWRKLQRDYGMEDEDGGGGGGGPGGGGPGGGKGLGGLAALDAAAEGGAMGMGGGKGAYVPRGRRDGGAGSMMPGAAPSSSFDDRDNATLRVSNISEDTTEADLQELFAPFGRLARVFLAKDRETGQSRGFAFVSFVQRREGQIAMDKLNGYGYDHLILKIEWAKPSAPKPDDGTMDTQFRSGYGKALAQDTTEKVSYASNLTANK
jgi:translation initiation factor 3 subunit G